MGMNRPGQSNQQVEQAKQMWSSLTRGRQIALAAAVVGVIVSFLPWSSYAGTGLGQMSAWGGWGFLAILGFLAAGAIVLLPLFGRSVQALIPSLPPTVTDARMVMGAGGIAVVATLLFIVTLPHDATSGVGWTPSFGAYIGLLCGVAIAAGGYLMQTEPGLV